MEYKFTDIEKKWQDYWKKNNTYKVETNSTKPKYYVLDMFPYPSGSGLHVGHPLGYIASDIYSRYKRHRGFNVLHPMGFDAFGLPAEQYAIQTGRHPKDTTEENIARYKEQLESIGFCYDWSREVITADPEYYKWTQWIFLQLFKSWFNKKTNKAESIDELVKQFEKQGNHEVEAATDFEGFFSEEEWGQASEEEKQGILMQYRLAYLSFAEVNWCEALGTVLANDEVKDGRSERGGYPVVKKRMRQWFLRITAYAERLLNDIDNLAWSDSMKEMQRNWIGRSEGAQVFFDIVGNSMQLEIYTTRPDTIFGATFMVVAPEHPLVDAITSPEHEHEVQEYRDYVQSRSERERQSEVKKVTGAFTGALAVNPFTSKKIPIFISEYVLMGYGTGAIMAVPADDDRDNAFADHFELPIIEVIDKSMYPGAGREDKLGKMINSGFLNGMEVVDAIKFMNNKLEEMGIGQRQIQYRIRDAIFGRQRYWGEPIPIRYKNNIPYALEESELPLVLPQMDDFKPSADGEPPLAKIDGWEYETTTMPGWAGSSWYFLRYMDPKNDKAFISKEAEQYWQDVDLYIGGTEHAVGHLLYSRLWQKVLFDRGYVSNAEPFKRLINQGMIQGVSQYILELMVDRLLEKDFNEEAVIIEISKEGKIIKEILLRQRVGDHPVGHHAYVTKDYNLEFKIKSQKTGKYLHYVLPEGRANIRFIDRVMINENEHFYLNIKRWQENEPVYRPIVINNNGYWHFENKIWLDFNDEPITDESKTYCLTRPEVEKMGKTNLNVVSPTTEVDLDGKEYPGIIEQYGADTFRMYEMFLGPIEQSKPWNTNGIDGVSKFVRKLWRLFYDETKPVFTDAPATDAELKVLHKAIKKISEDIERISFNTCISTFMVTVNELQDLKCHKKEVLKDLVVLIAPFAPHVAEELWQALGNNESVTGVPYPDFNPKYLVESAFEYPVQINGKLRTKIELPLDIEEGKAQQEVLASEVVQKWLEGKSPKKFIYVKGKVINIAV